MSSVERLLEFARAPHALPAAVRANTVRLIGDTLVIGAAGATAPGAAEVLAAARSWGDGKAARTIGGDAPLPAAGAAFVNGFRIHCLEWDAVHEPAVVHAMSVVTAAVGAAIDQSGGVSADEAIAAIAVGVEVAAGFGDAASSPLSFFRPSTAGCLGAALAVARITGAPANSALGLAYGFCSGTMQAHVEGSIALPLQIANAARSSVMAADLAAKGLEGPKDVLDGAFGYFSLFDRGDSGALIADLGTRWRISEVSTKPFPCGRASHALLSGISELRLEPESLHSLRLLAPSLVNRLIGRPMKPDMSTAYARLCGPFLAALMLTDGCIDPRRFLPTSFNDPGLSDLADRIHIEEDGTTDPNALSPQKIVAETTSGRVELEIPHTLGSPEVPMSSGQSNAKLQLTKELALPECDPRVFSDPLAYLTEPS